MRTTLRFLMLCSVTVSAEAAVVDSGAGGFTIENTVDVPVAPEIAWDAQLAVAVDRVQAQQLGSLAAYLMSRKDKGAPAKR